MKLTAKWNNWTVFLVGAIMTLITTPFVEPLYSKLLYTGSGFSSFILPSYFDTYPSTFLLLYTFFIAFFYRAFAKNFRSGELIYFLALPILLFISSLSHLITFFGLFIAGFLLGMLVNKFSSKAV